MIKRIFDFICSLIGLILLSPIFVFIALWIKADSKGPIFFKQIRVGQYGKEFKIHKFRTMVNGAPKKGLAITVGQDSRITKVGRFLRKYKLDELPQLIDVLRGKMSLVGPRPEIPQYVNLYPEGVKEKVLSVKPGITDMASIEMIDENDLLAKYDDAQKAYIEIIMPEKLEYYLDYVNKKNFIYDLKIIYLTIRAILLR